MLSGVLRHQPTTECFWASARVKYLLGGYEYKYVNVMSVSVMEW